MKKNELKRLLQAIVEDLDPSTRREIKALIVEQERREAERKPLAGNQTREGKQDENIS